MCVKKIYVRPSAHTVSMRLNENIATSRPHDYPNNGDDIRYIYDQNGTKYIAFSSIEASVTGDERFDRFMDRNMLFIHNLSNCGHSSVMPI